MRKLIGINNGNTDRKIAVYFDRDYDEYVVKFYEHGTYLVASDYHTDDKADAYDTASNWVNQPNRIDQCMAAFGGFPA